MSWAHPAILHARGLGPPHTTTDLHHRRGKGEQRQFVADSSTQYHSKHQKHTHGLHTAHKGREPAVRPFIVTWYRLESVPGVPASQCFVLTAVFLFTPPPPPLPPRVSKMHVLCTSRLLLSPSFRPHSRKHSRTHIMINLSIFTLICTHND